jgi:hypothetical protein
LGLSGCTNDAAEPSPLASPSGSASPSPTATVADVAPSLPARARGASAAAAAAFAQHYVDLINFAIHSGNTRPLGERSARRCSGCSAIADSVNDFYRKSGRVSGGAWTVRSARVSRHGEYTGVSLRLRISRQTVYENPSASPSVSRANVGRLELRLKRTSGEWSVQRLDAYG